MSPILGVFAAQLPGRYAQPSASYDSIATVALASSAASISFTSIPATYKHLQIRLLARSTDSAGTVNVNMSLNGGPGSTWHRIFGNGTSVGVNAQISASAIIGQISGATAPSSVFGVATIDILDYANTNKYKTSRSLFGFDDNAGGSGAVTQLFSGLWQESAAVTTIALTSGGGFAQYTHAALYGIRG